MLALLAGWLVGRYAAATQREFYVLVDERVQDVQAVQGLLQEACSVCISGPVGALFHQRTEHFLLTFPAHRRG